MGENTQNRINSNRLELILEVGRAFNSVIGVDSLLGIIADRTAKLLDAERCSIYVVDADSGSLWTRAAVGEQRIEIPIDTGIAGAVVSGKAVINVPDAYQDGRFNQEVDRKTGFRTKTILAGPMKNSAGELIGVFQLLNSFHGAFNEEDEELLEALSGFAANALENALLYDELKTTFHSVLQVLAATIDAKHPYTAGHTARVAEHSCGIAETMGLDPADIEVIRVAAYLHDYGKIAIRDAVLTKPGKLTDEEYAEMKSHAARTKKILSRMHFASQYSQVPAVAGAHHEKFDGTGYPNRLENDSIPLGARIMAVADVFDALASERDYKKAMPLPKVMEIMRADRGAAFDPEVFDAFEKYVQKRFAS